MNKLEYLLAFVADCSDHLGVENGDIQDENIQASHTDWTHYAHKGRLNAASSAWIAPGSNHQPWIQADIGYQTYVSGVATQGAYTAWVTSIKVSTFYMTTADTETFVSEDGEMAKVNITVLLQLWDLWKAR